MHFVLLDICIGVSEPPFSPSQRILAPIGKRSMPSCSQEVRAKVRPAHVDDGSILDYMWQISCRSEFIVPS